MNRKTSTSLFLGAAALAVAATFTLASAPAEADFGCTDCGGPTRTATGYGSGNSCAEALQQAEIDATQKSFADAHSCLPCQTSSGAQACGIPSCYPGPCAPGAYVASFSLNYKCQVCDFGPIDPLSSP